MKKLKIKVKRPFIAYPGSTMQQNYAEDREHGYLLWDINTKNDFDVKFRPLPNTRPFITLDWKGSVRDTYDLARKFPMRSRFRIKHREHVSHKDAIALTTTLKQELNASEVIFKGEQQTIGDYFNAGSTVVMKDDLRNPQILVRLLKDFYKDTVVTDEEWAEVQEQIKDYLSNINDDGTIRNVAWSLKHLKFDNLFCYGEGNVINFRNLNGIVGIFGPNRSGKSSLPGTLMYSLFNSTDRGSIKNLHVCNSRKQHCYSRVILGINGIDYVIERQTTKNENKRGEINAATALNFYRVDEGTEIADQSGEQRTDTEKTIRKYIGAVDDFALTSLSAQGEINQVIDLGSTKRNQMLSRFLDLDIFYKLYQFAAQDFNVAKVALKQLPEKDWQRLAQEKSKLIKEYDRKIEELTASLSEAHERLNLLRHNMLKHHNVVAVTPVQVEQQHARVDSLTQQLAEANNKIDENRSKIDKDSSKLLMIDDLKKEYDIDDLRRRQDAYHKLEASVSSLQHAYAKEAELLKLQKRSLKILDSVPCGDQYPTCTFIKDAHLNKEKISDQKQRVEVATQTLERARAALDELKHEDVAAKINKIEDLNKLYSRLLNVVSNLKVENAKLETAQSLLVETLRTSSLRLKELQEALQNDENVEVVTLRNEIDALQRAITVNDNEKLSLADQRGREVQAVEMLATERQRRKEALQSMKIYELITVAFSKNGIPSVILADRLPNINSEIAKILSGIVDFTVELEKDEESEQLEIFINYGDSRRLIELASGMEKAISSIALRVALINVSSLPKTDIFVIDEGFGVFDDAGIEAINRLLVSLKHYFRVIFVITHVDGIKDVADQVLEITKNEKDSHVVFE